MMNDNNDNDVIKALECCKMPVGSGACNKCSLKDIRNKTLTDGEKSCTTIMIESTLDLINRLQAEIERLSKLLKLEAEGANTLNDVIAERDAEIERLTGLRNSDPMDFCGVLCKYSEELINKAKSEARKEFAERVKKLPYIPNRLNLHKAYDNLLKELDGEENEDENNCKN